MENTVYMAVSSTSYCANSGLNVFSTSFFTLEIYGYYIFKSARNQGWEGMFLLNVNCNGLPDFERRYAKLWPCVVQVHQGNLQTRLPTQQNSSIYSSMSLFLLCRNTASRSLETYWQYILNSLQFQNMSLYIPKNLVYYFSWENACKSHITVYNDINYGSQLLRSYDEGS